MDCRVHKERFGICLLILAIDGTIMCVLLNKRRIIERPFDWLHSLRAAIPFAVGIIQS